MTPYELAALLRNKREAAKMTQKDLAIRAGCNEHTVGQYEAGINLGAVARYFDLLEALGADLIVRPRDKSKKWRGDTR